MNENQVTESTNMDAIVNEAAETTSKPAAEAAPEQISVTEAAAAGAVSSAAEAVTAPATAAVASAPAEAAAAQQGEEEYHDVFWYAVQALKANATQSTWKPAVIPEQCDNKELAACEGGCGSCGFKCGRALFDQQPRRTGDGEIPGPDPFAERNPVHMAEPPEPETTFPLPQVVIAIMACIGGCYLAERIIHLLFG